MALMIYHLVLVLLLALRARAQQVFAHVIVGNTYSYTEGDWASDIQAAMGAGIDAFALNCGYTDTQDNADQGALENAFNAADAAGFKLFFSFDYDAQGPWEASVVVSTMNAYSGRESYFKINGQPLASTFEGPANAGDWGSIKQQTNAIFMPDYTSQGPINAANEPNVDGLLSWAAWPDGPNDMSDSEDQQFISALNGRPYIMPVSPWFYTNLPQYNKNWLWRGDDLWHDRWQLVFQLKPQYVEILTWNDYGESHYVGPLPPSSIASQSMPPGTWYAQNIPHNAWLNDLPYYIAEYKGESLPDEPHFTYWYRLNPGQSGSDAGTQCNSASQGDSEEYAPYLCDTDYVFFTVFVASSATATATIQIGSNSPTTVTAFSPGIFHSSVPFNNQLGAVVMSATASDGTNLGPVIGPAITTSNEYDGDVNWNTWVGGD